MAKSYKKEILGISTVEVESKIIDEIGLEIQIQLLLESIDQTNIENGKERRKRVLSLYQQHDIDGLYNTFKNAMVEYEGLLEFMFHKRHEVWIPNMQKHMEGYSCFFVVGVGHLAGDEGLIELLRQEGFQVNAVNMD